MAFPNQEATVYNDTVVRQFAIMTVVWGVVGMLVGVIIAAQLAWPELNFGIPWLSYGRLRPLHTNAVIFAFGGCGLFAASYYVVQRTCQVRLFGEKLAAFTFWGWQLVILAAAISLPLGYTQGKEYAELEWPIDILITLVWVSYAVVFFGTVGVRRVKHIYVANWFFGAFILAVAILHLVNSAAIPHTVIATRWYPFRLPFIAAPPGGPLYHCSCDAGHDYEPVDVTDAGSQARAAESVA